MVSEVLELLGESLDRVRDRVRKLSFPALADIGVAMLRALREVRGGTSSKPQHRW